MDSSFQSQKPLFLSDLSQQSCSQSFHSQNRCFSLLKVDRKNIEGALNLQSLEETICIAKFGNAVSCLTSLAAAISDHKSSAFQNCEVLIANLTRSESSFGNLEDG
ncbi:hypothetical protein HPP92_002916 [Vanilla planifolia]|uniref:Uncharacterized protein n=1 Tax=Vanilla planifolia TaxID=51239 RepID=A0A835S758_VANPL|nr:hypothetical protein HPP92_002916 [Vanilla planifolia]